MDGRSDRASGRTRRHSLGSTAKVFAHRSSRGGPPNPRRRGARPRSGGREASSASAGWAHVRRRGRFLSGRLRGFVASRFATPRRALSSRPYFAPLCAMAITDITRADVASCLTATARRHTPNTAASARRWASSLFAWTIEEGWLLTDNPVTGTRRPQRAAARERVLSDPELAAVWRTAGDNDYARIVRLLILTGARRQEVGGLCWSEINFETGEWTSPPRDQRTIERTRSHCRRPRSRSCTAVPRRACDQLFGSLWGENRGFAIWGRGKSKLDARLPEFQSWTLHDLRRTVATGMINLGVEPQSSRRC